MRHSIVNTNCEEIKMTYLVRGLDNDGNETFYTGKTGNGWLTSNWRGAFTYSLNGARARATNLNKMTEIHGIRFVAITRAAYISKPHISFLGRDFAASFNSK